MSGSHLLLYWKTNLSPKCVQAETTELKSLFFLKLSSLCCLCSLWNWLLRLPFRLAIGFLLKASELKMVTSTMDAVDEGVPNFEEFSSKTEAVHFALVTKRMNSAYNLTNCKRIFWTISLLRVTAIEWIRLIISIISGMS